MQVSRWGNSLAVRLPAAVVEALGLQEGDEIAIEATDRTHFRVARELAPGRSAGGAPGARLDTAGGLPLRPR